MALAQNSYFVAVVGGKVVAWSLTTSTALSDIFRTHSIDQWT